MSESAVAESAGKIPVLLLKTRSTPHDGYEEHFSALVGKRKWPCEPVFVPVLEHRFRKEALDDVRDLLQWKQITSLEGAKYGGLIFTSQRAVEAFATVVEDGAGTDGLSTSAAQWPHLQSIPIYTVGPATSRALQSIPQDPPLNIFGSETGNGEALAHFILDHYDNWYADRPSKPPLLFLVGERRRDIIPKILMDSTRVLEQQIPVHELVIYETGVMKGFEQDFEKLLISTEHSRTRWIVVFSPTGCESMLRALDMLDASTGRVKTGERGGGCGNRKGKGKRSIHIATIGPTTRDYLRKAFGFEPDVCATQPSPESLGSAIESFMEKNYSD